MSENKLLTAGEAAAYLRVNVSTLRRYIRQHKVRAAKLGKGYRIKQDDLDAFLRSLTEDDIPLTPEEIADVQAGWADYLAGKGKPLDQVIQEQLRDRAD
ncbi:MAG: helix-turn-helix domain-containing protein [Armatimonadota bacterium]|jgi:excisionase family DNA binding protein